MRHLRPEVSNQLPTPLQSQHYLPHKYGITRLIMMASSTSYSCGALAGDLNGGGGDESIRTAMSDTSLMMSD